MILSALFFIFLIMLPFDARASFLPGHLGDQVRWADFSGFAFLIVWLIDAIKNKRVRENLPYAAFALLLFFAALISWCFTGAFVSGILPLIKLLYLAFIFIACRDTLEKINAVDKVLETIVIIQTVIATLTLCCVLLYNFGINTDLVSYRGSLSSVIMFARATGFAFGSNAYALDLHFSIIFTVLLYYRHKTEKKTSLRFLIYLILQGITLFFTASRLIVGTLLGCWYLLYNTQRKGIFSRIAYNLFKLTFVVMLPALLVFTLWTVAPISFQKPTKEKAIPTIIWNRTPSIYNLNSQAGFAMFMENPIFGVGLGNFISHQGLYIDQYVIDPHHVYGTRKHVKEHVPHQVYTGWVSQTGLFGFATLMLFFGFFWRQMHQEITKKRSHTKVALLACFLGLVFQSFFTDFLFSRFLWVYLALCSVVFEMKLSITRFIPLKQK